MYNHNNRQCQNVIADEIVKVLALEDWVTLRIRQKRFYSKMIICQSESEAAEVIASMMGPLLNNKGREYE